MITSMTKATEKCAVCGKDSTEQITVNINPGVEKIDEPMTVRIVPLCDEHAAEQGQLGGQAFFDKHPDPLS